MKVLMDTDCLIKLTKSMLKELVCGNFSVIIPQIVKEEVTDNAKEHPDAAIIKGNIETGLLTINKMRSSAQKGEDAVFATFRRGKFDAICSDDKRFIKRLRLFDIPYITPSVFIAILLKKGKLTIKEAHKKLDSLSPFVSEDEYNAVKLVLDNWRTQ
jgi:rRNA-processing protein FCF1